MQHGRRTSRFARKLGCASLVALAIGLPLAASHAAIYKYTDRAGVTHYSDSYGSVPSAYRDQVRDVADDMQAMTGFNVIEGLNGGPSAARKADDPQRSSGPQLGGGEMLRGLLGSLGFGVVLMLLIAVPIALVVGGLILQLAFRIAGADPPGLGRAVAILFVQGLAGGAVGGLTAGFARAMGIDQAVLASASLAVAGTSCLLSWLANAAVLTGMADCSFLRALWVCVVHTVLVVLLVLGPIVAIAALVRFAG